MKPQTIFITALLIFILSCKQYEENTPVLFYLPEVVEARGYVVPKDSIAEPKLLPIGNPWVVPAGKPKVIPVATKVHPAGNPEVILAVTTVHQPGQGSFSLPKTFPAIGKTILAGSPEVIIAKDAIAKDQNSTNFSSFGTLQGLINASIHSILEDKKGNLWIGTYGGGVCKYDGVSFTHFTEKEGLVSNIVVSILEDKNENLWFGTLGGGICKYDGKTFTRFTENEGLGSDFVNCIAEDQSGNLWIGTTGGGVTKYDPADRRSIVEETQLNHHASQPSFTRFTENEGLSTNTILSILEDKKGNLWFGTTGGGICKYDDKSFTIFNEKEDLHFGLVKAILEDKKGELWFGTWEHGAYKFDGKYFTHFTTKEGLSNNNVKTILEDKDGSLWIGTEGGGINLYDPGDSSTRGPSTFTYFTEKDGLSDNIIHSILKDKNGILWIGTGNNLNKYMGKSITHFTEKDGLTGRIKCILESKNGNLWFGGSDGLSMYDGKFITHFTEKDGLFQDNVNAILEDKNGNLWIGSYAGATKYDGKSFIHFMGSTGLGWGNVHSIKEDKTGNLWFGKYGGGVIKYDGKSFSHFAADEGLNSNWVWTILEDKGGNFWVGTSDKGINKYSPFEKDMGFTHFTEKEGNGRKNVYSILEDKKGNLWFGTGGGGVTCYNPSSDTGKTSGQHAEKLKSTHYSKKEGLISDFVMGILEDKNNNLWFCTTDGISKLDKNYLQKIADQKSNPNNQSNNDKTPILFKNFDYTDGFHGTTASQNAICEDKNGIIWIGTSDRLTALNPSEEIPDSIPPNIQLTGLALFNEYISWQDLEKKRDSNIVLGNGDRIPDLEFEEVNKWYGVPQQLNLAYDNNHLTFRYVGITIHSPQKVRYQYMLNGLDKNWSALTDRTEISYTNLSHGKYIFKVKAINSEGYWSKELNYPFRIRPPWWLSTWAYSFYGLCFIISVIIIHRIQRRRIIIKERDRSREKELVQAKEIEKAYHELKATQVQLIQSEKMASLGELTAGIAHEIQNPLNFVNNFSEVNTELIDELEQEADKGNLDEVKAIAKDIKENEQKINHHGKRADGIVKGMLQHSRSSSGVKEPTDINALADEYLRLAYHGLRAKDNSFNATLKTDFDESVGNINIIPQDIGRVFLNLYNNAFYAAPLPPEGGFKNPQQKHEPTVWVSTKKIGDKVFISVRDNGPGIPQKVLDKIFQPFFTTKPTGQGTGLGLSLAYDIVKAHGGELKVETTEGEGAEFIIQLFSK